MNRSALTIKMLNYLKAHDVVSRSELALYLETNVRNIAEFKKELETAGYHIESIHGPQGGYHLAEDSLIVTLPLDDIEVKALNDAQTFLSAHRATFLSAYEEALIKIKGNLRAPSRSSDIYYLRGSASIANEDLVMASCLEIARNEKKCVSFQYKTLSGKHWEERLIQPYELINTESGYYVLAYDMTRGKRHMFKHFKITHARMREVLNQEQVFCREQNFKIEDHIGKQGLFQDVYEVELQIYGHHARLMSEMDVGMAARKEMTDGVLYLSFQMENKMRIVEFILSLGADCRVMKPFEIRQKVEEQLERTLQYYK